MAVGEVEADDGADATARIDRNRRVRSSPRWSTSVMTDSSPGAAAGGGGRFGSGVTGSPPTPGSRRASASAIGGLARPASLRRCVESADGAVVVAVGAAGAGRRSGARPGRRGAAAAGGGGRGGGRPAAAARCRRSRHRLLDVGRRLAELADALAERGADVGQLARAEDEQRDDQDDDQLEGPGCTASSSLLRIGCVRRRRSATAPRLCGG